MYGLSARNLHFLKENLKVGTNCMIKLYTSVSISNNKRLLKLIPIYCIVLTSAQNTLLLLLQYDIMGLSGVSLALYSALLPTLAFCLYRCVCRLGSPGRHMTSQYIRHGCNGGHAYLLTHTHPTCKRSPYLSILTPPANTNTTYPYSTHLQILTPHIHTQPTHPCLIQLLKVTLHVHTDPPFPPSSPNLFMFAPTTLIDPNYPLSPHYPFLTPFTLTHSPVLTHSHPYPYLPHLPELNSSTHTHSDYPYKPRISNYPYSPKAPIRHTFTNPDSLSY